MKKFIKWVFDFRTAKLWHPESPGMKVDVTRSRFGRFFKSDNFATYSECAKSSIVWETMNDHISCPVCGYYCLGKGGNGCIDKTSM